ncbi:DUF2158 domain-containing protein [Acidithiobacillus sp. 'AMD consortium']|uniref:DUF2158 domain-containing protein n=1 Tax=Acidithiobacillus sp. 'AMD consortium' TaxID=2614801 RepID=UPI00124EA801|nr:DUF2158 domain-containing protein [Acidithiobacillus sp. 'AMD consortium']QFG77845.1 DUF2158 domain-containing protein [Acidithiobacillus sp. 'AMD consortium']
MKFQAGDRVKLKSGSKEMAVVQYIGLGTIGLRGNFRSSINIKRVKCSCIDGSKMEQTVFDESELEILVK